MAQNLIDVGWQDLHPWPQPECLADRRVGNLGRGLSAQLKRLLALFVDDETLLAKDNLGRSAELRRPAGALSGAAVASPRPRLLSPAPYPPVTRSPAPRCPVPTPC
jgi:hypothetical protein